jgi:hypothetical protein
LAGELIGPHGKEKAYAFPGAAPNACQALYTTHWVYDALARASRRGGYPVLAEQALLCREHRGGGPAGGADLGVDVLDVITDRLRRDHQPLGDLLVGHAAREQDEHLLMGTSMVLSPVSPGEAPLSVQEK